MIQRKEVVLSVLGELQEATESSGLNALTRVALEVDQILAPFALPTTPWQDLPQWACVDEAARDLYPADALRVRTVVDMVLWKRYYLSGMIDSKMMLQAVRFSLCAEESEDMLNLPVAVLEAIFDADVKASCFPGSYANMWHVYALSSVLQFNIYSIYPMFNLKIRPYFNRVIRPRTRPDGSEPQTIHIMWSGVLHSRSLFRPGNFVALVQTGDDSDRQESPGKAEEALSQELQLSYPNLKDKYNITKRTFYRWKRQTQEHCKKSAARYEAKHFLQACYLEGKLMPLHQFKKFFPEISRSSYYNWKHELLKTGGSFSTSLSTGEVSPGESTEQEAWSSPEGRQEEQEHHDSVAGMFGLSLSKLELERAHSVANMQEAKRCLQSSIATNTSLPFRVFKKNFPGISRSTYYNWRREAMLFTRGYKGGLASSEDSSDADKCQSPSSLSPVPPQPAPPRARVCRSRHRSFRLAYMSKKQLRDAAKLHVQKSKWSLMKFRLRFPTTSPCFYWLWRGSLSRGRKVAEEDRLPAGGRDPAAESTSVARVPTSHAPRGKDPQPLQRPSAPSSDAPPSKHAHPKVSLNQQMFVMDVVALANFKAKAKLFLQQRFEQKAFPTFKEFRSYFPFTPRSTYYMWKRALYHGVSLIHG
ncbi:unnamed protein product, partial [Tetraodon nigroviridis]